MKYIASGLAAAALLFSVAVTSAQAQSGPNTCNVVQEYGGTSIRDDLDPGFYFLYVLTDSGFQAYRLGYSNGRIRFPIGQATFPAYLIVTPEGQIVSAC
jgi:hypothetical protein